MAKERAAIQPSVLDRLIDREPDRKQEPPLSAHQVLVEMRLSVRRNLEDILNTRIRATSLPAHLKELPTSLANYGIPDITAAQLQSEQSRKLFLRDVERRIQHFEPRLEHVRVIQVEGADYMDRTLRFRIDATLLAYPNPEPIIFDSQFDPTMGNIKIEGGAR